MAAEVRFMHRVLEKAGHWSVGRSLLGPCSIKLKPKIYRPATEIVILRDHVIGMTWLN